LGEWFKEILKVIFNVHCYTVSAVNDLSAWIKPMCVELRV
jgi:hypothetical protein